MIPRTSARRLETTLRTCSRQRLPRAARLAGAVAFNDMQGFLQRQLPWTILPPPLPDDRKSALNTFLFTDSPTQDQFAVMDACLHNLYDVPRAKQVFERLRKSPSMEHLLEARIYNSFLEAYVEMATTKQPSDRRLWVEDALQLYLIMESGQEKVQPTSQTYAIMLLAWLRYDWPRHDLFSCVLTLSARFNPESETPVPYLSTANPSKLLSSLIARGISPTTVITDRVVSSSDEASQIIRLLSKTAVDMNLSRIVTELGQAEAIGCQLIDPLEDVPEVNPVMKLKVSLATMQFILTFLN